MTSRIVAVVVTYNRHELLRRCIDAIRVQHRRPDAILVVDNGCTDGTTEMLAAAEYADVDVLRIDVNDGASRGFHAGMERACAQHFDWVWVMDDDAAPAPDCLEALLARMAVDAADVYVPLQIDSRGFRYGFGIWRNGEDEVTERVVRGEAPEGVKLFRFVGPLIARRLLTDGHRPNPRFYIWFDDIEFALRIQLDGGAAVRFVPEAIMHHDFGPPPQPASFLGRRSLRHRYAPWKEYYGTRNYLYTLVRMKRVRNAAALLRYARQQMRCLIGDLMYESDRWTRTSLRLLGIVDGLFGRLGRRV